MARTGERYTSARMRVLDRRKPRKVAVTNGDSVAGTLRQAGLADVVISWRDQLAEGPVPSLPPAQLRQARAVYLAARYGYSASEVEHGLAQRDQALSRHARHDLTLWFEGDLQDQLQLLQVLSRLGQVETRGVIEMVSVSEHPDRARFGGLGELAGAQLEGLLPMARTVSASGMSLASRAWAAFTAPEPSALIALRGVVSPELRYLGDAVGRLLQEYPSRSDGLSVTQRRILLAVAAGLKTLPQILRSHWESELRPFLGDLSLKAEMESLTRATSPALAVAGGRYSLTSFGERLIEGTADWVEANGIDRWIGGVHLLGADARWRYDERLETVRM